IVPVEGSSTTTRDVAAHKSRRDPSGTSGPQDDGRERGASPYGVNNENLPERLQEALRRLVLQFSTESEESRRQEVRRIKQAHQFWRGLQYLWWDERDQNWHLPFEQKIMRASRFTEIDKYRQPG